MPAVVHAILLAAICCGLSSADQWTPPAVEAAPAQLPRLAALLVLDGEVREWSGAASVPVRSRADITYLSHLHPWRGAADASMEVCCAWNDAGLALAVVVADDDVRTQSQDDLLWQMDCVELFVDGRVGEEFMGRAYSAGAYQILLRPPSAGRPARAYVNKRDGTIQGLRVAGKKTPAGYNIELVIPWSAFPGVSPQPGAALGLQFSLDEYDARDGKLIRPLLLTPLAASDLWMRPDRLIKWTLVDKVSFGPKESLGPLAVIDAPAMHATLKPIRVNVELGKLLSSKAGSLRIEITGSDGRKALQQAMKLSAAPGPWKDRLRASLSWKPASAPDGYYTVNVTALDQMGKPLGRLARLLLYLGNVVPGSIARIERGAAPGLAARAPFKAAAYLGAASCIEKLKRNIELGKPGPVVSAVHETQARLAVLERGTTHEKREMLDLLNLAADTEAQIVVQYPDGGYAAVTAYWGSFPLADAQVRSGESGSGRVITASSASPEAAKLFAGLVESAAPITVADVDAVRAEVVKSLQARLQPANAPDGAQPFCGDLHMHTFYSDGKPSPAGLALQAMHCFMDFAAITDHNTIKGAQLAQSQLSRHGFAFPLIVGEEITTEWSHFNAYPLKSLVPWDVSLYEICKQAHAQGAVIQWNHPTAVRSPWALSMMDSDLRNTGLDAWEHMPPDYADRKPTGRLPVVVGTTDTHDGTFAYPERTIVLAPSPHGPDIAESIRLGRVTAVLGLESEVYYGPDDMVAAVLSALADGPGTKAAKAKRLSTELARANIAALLRESKPFAAQ